MKLKKWNYTSHLYDDYEIPESWNVPLMTDDFEETVNCPHCGKELTFGETYTSLEIHTKLGFGYGVCHECYAKEWERKRKK